MKAKIFLLFSLVAITHSSHGQISWERRKITRDVAENEQVVELKFAFVNSGTNAIEITSVKPSCGCTTAELSKKQYLPDERGELIVKFEPGSRTGIQKKSVFVETNNPNASLYELQLEFNMPEVLTVDPLPLKWNINEALTTKTIRVQRNPFVKTFNIVGVEGTNENFKYKLRTIKNSEVYEILVTPRSTSTASKVTFRLESDLPKEKPAVYYAYAEID